MVAGKRLVYTVFVEDPDGNMKSFGPDDDLPEWAVKAITNPSAWGEDFEEEPLAPSTPGTSDVDPDVGGDADGDSDDGNGDDDPGVDYDALKKADLQAAVAARNEGREDDDLIVVGGNGTKADLVAALRADDEADE